MAPDLSRLIMMYMYLMHIKPLVLGRRKTLLTSEAGHTAPGVRPMAVRARSAAWNLSCRGFANPLICIKL